MLLICGAVASTTIMPNYTVTVGAKTPCNHVNCGTVRYGKSLGMETKDVSNNATYCYKTREYYRQKCAARGKPLSSYSYDSWEYHEHKYGFFNKTCKRCGRKK